MWPVELMGRVKRRYLVAVGAVVAAGVALPLAFMLTRSGGAAPGIFRTVSVTKLAVGGLRLSAPRSARPSAAAGRAAARAASKQFDDRKVLEYHYVHCVDPPGVDEDCWAVSLDPSGLYGNGGSSGIAPQKASYLVVLIYPVGDAFIEAQQGA
jgi:hypothetical protein